MIANQCNNDELFLCFYRELRNRHMFATTNVRDARLRFSPPLEAFVPLPAVMDDIHM